MPLSATGCPPSPSPPLPPSPPPIWQLLVVEGAFLSKFGAMREFDFHAARLILLATLLGRRAVIPSMPCGKQWAMDSMEPRHLRGLEVIASECIGLPLSAIFGI